MLFIVAEVLKKFNSSIYKRAMLSFVKSTLQLTIYEICTIRGASDNEVLS